jgi:isoquinoline 1-oxidoreductase beta subunit
VSEGKPDAFALHLSSPSLFSSLRRRSNAGINNNVVERIDQASTMGAREQPYNIKNYRVTAHAAQQLLPVGWLRGVGETQNVFFHDSAIDELAHAAGADPLKMRISLLEHAPSRTVLKLVEKMSQWGSTLPDGHARGVAYALSSGAATAQVIEISKNDDGIRIEKVFAAIDVGIALDPINIEAQVQSSIIFGLCAAMDGAITVTDGKVDQTNFHNYLIMRIDQAPEIEVSIHESGSKIYGVGESGTATAAPALGNAIFALTGQRIRELPFAKSIKFVSKQPGSPST